MKINKTIRDLYKKYNEIAILQRKFYDPIFSAFCNDNSFFYDSRIKQLESFALKIETGRNAYEDFFACRFVVIQKKDIFELKRRLLSDFGLKIRYSRPTNINQANHSPENFAFDELRMYVVGEQKKNVEEKPFLNVLFEIQIMTLYSYV